MIIDCIADLHGHYPTLEGGDLLIVAGDLTAGDPEELVSFAEWIAQQKYKKIIVIAGNHDNLLVGIEKYIFLDDHIEYLCDSGTNFQGLKIWGAPWTKWFPGVNPYCTAFMLKESKLTEKWSKIPAHVDILVTHGPPYGILDKNSEGVLCGCLYLRKAIDHVKPQLHVFGHIHEAYGEIVYKHKGPHTLCVNASHMNEYYQPVNAPIRVIL